MQLKSKYNKGFCFLLCVTAVNCKRAWVVPSKDKKGIAIINPLNESGHKPKKI